MKSAASYPVVAILCLVMSACGSSEPGEGSEPQYENLSDAVRYVGSEACSSCHPDKYQTFSQAQMGRSFKEARIDHSAADWEDVEPVYDEDLDLFYQAFHRGGDLFIMEYRIAEGDTVHKRVEQIDYIVGSGQHTNSHIMSVNGYLYQMPMTWYAQDGKWDLPPKFDGGNNYRFSRPITEPCMTCHNAIPGFVEGSENKFATVPHGIDCERCHGPGELHVEEKRAGNVVNTATEIDYTIVNPGKLELNRQFDVCQRCHMQGATVFTEGMEPDDFKPGMNLTEVLNVFWPRYADSTSRFIMASHPDRLKMSDCFIGTYEPESNFEGMTCITCHDPHLPIETLGADHYRSVCQSCHEPEGDGGIALETTGMPRHPLARASERPGRPVAEASDRPGRPIAEASDRPGGPNAEAALRRAARPSSPNRSEGPLKETRQDVPEDLRQDTERGMQQDSQSLAPSAGACTAPIELRRQEDDNCVTCHMPVSGSQDIPHVRVTDHYIRVVEEDPETDLTSLRGSEMAIGDAPKLAGELEGSTAESDGSDDGFVGLASLVASRVSEREMADGYMAYFEEISNVPYFLDSAAVHLDRALEESSADELATSLVRLHYLQRDYDALVRLSKQLDTSAISDAWTLYRIGEAYANTGNTTEALSYFRLAVERAPYHLRFINRLGMSYVSNQRYDEALTAFDRVLSENPKFEEAYNNRGFARAMQGDLQGAEADLKQAIALNPNAEQAIANLASLYLNTQRAEAAKPYAERLLELDPVNENYRRLWQLLQ